LQKTIPNIEQGWEGKQKGLLQVPWKQGWIDVASLDKHAIVKERDMGPVDEDFSLQRILESCLAFANEATELQVLGDKMEVGAVTTTNFHAEMAGEGTEHLWGVAKSWCGTKPVEVKRKKASFCSLCETAWIRSC
jgi:hypothetical protein